jgi:hypothetical protein
MIARVICMGGVMYSQAFKGLLRVMRWWISGGVDSEDL